MVVAVGMTLSVGCAPDRPPQRLRMAYPHELVTMDPHTHADAVTRLVMSAVYESLVRFEPGQPVKPGLADRWITPDESTWRIHVRDGVRFHDGRSLMPEDVVASIERARAIGFLGHQLDEIEHVRVLDGDERTIEITTAVPEPLLLTMLEMVAIVPQDFSPSNPIGTGPYRWRMGSVQGPVLLDRWSDYWARSPDFDEVSINFVSVIEELADLLQSHQVDVVASVTMSYVWNHDPDPSWRVVVLPTVATTYLGLNVTKPPLDDLRVRQAIDEWIDRRRIVAAAYPPGLATHATSLVSYEVFGFSPVHRRNGPDPDHARRLLADAGVPSGSKLRLDYQERYAPVIEPLVSSLAELGLEIEPRNHPYESYYRRLEEAKNELFLFSWNFRVADASPFLEAIVHSRNSQCHWGSLNGAAVSDPELDRLIEQASHETRSETRLEMLQLLLNDVSDVHAYLPLYRPSALALVREPFDVVGRQLRPQDVRLR